MNAMTNDARQNTRIQLTTRHCLCEGKCQERLYIERLQYLLKEQGYSVRLTQEKIDPSPGGITSSMFASHSNVVAIFDHDGRSNFPEMVQLCSKNSLFPAYSNRCFDLWLLLHKADCANPVTDNKAYIDRIRQSYHLGSEADIKKKEIAQKIADAITYEDVRRAINRAKVIQKGKLLQDGKTYGKHICYEQPDLRIYEFVEKLIDECQEKKKKAETAVQRARK